MKGGPPRGGVFLGEMRDYVTISLVPRVASRCVCVCVRSWAGTQSAWNHRVLALPTEAQPCDSSITCIKPTQWTPIQFGPASASQPHGEPSHTGTLVPQAGSYARSHQIVLWKPEQHL